jgi:YVTN family beta-propeller protein
MRRSLAARMTARGAVVVAIIGITVACTGTETDSKGKRASSAASSSTPAVSTVAPTPTPIPTPTPTVNPNNLPGMPALLKESDVYAADKPGMISPQIAGDRALVYVPNSMDNTVSVIDQATMTVINTFKVGNEPQHVVPSYDLKTLYVISDVNPGDGFVPIDPKTGEPGAFVSITDPYNMYFTPDGQYAIVVAEYYKRLDFYDPHTWEKKDSLSLPNCSGVDHMDFSADGRILVASCEFANRLAVIDVATHTLIRTITLDQRSNGMPQDVKLSPDGQVFYIADMIANGIYMVDGAGNGLIGFIPTGKGTHGLYVDRNSTRMFITNRLEGTISILDLATRTVTTKWVIPGGGSPDMGNLSADGKIFWVSGRYDSVVYAISTDDGSLIAKIKVGRGPHGLTVWPQPGRYSLGHTGILR